MKTYISILRGINVGGTKKIKMDALREMYATLGFTKIQSYIQSGNVIFNSSESDTSQLAKLISKKIAEVFGFEVPVLVLTVQEIKTAIENNPFLSDSSKDAAFMHFTFLSEFPDSKLLQSIDAAKYLPDEFCCLDKVIYLYCPNGYGNTKLTNTFFENKLKRTATTRNLRTVGELVLLSEKQL